MAKNDVTQADQNGEYDDWIELYNTKNLEISLSGHYLSDDPAVFNKWAFPDTVIAGNDYLIVWADDDIAQEGLHANFKLSASDGENLYFTDPAESLIDEVTFGPQYADTTTGRFPNGTGPFILMHPTFSAENSEAINVERIQFAEISLFPNPASDYFIISSEDEQNIDLEIIKLTGQTVFFVETKPNSVINISDLSKGLYLVKINNTTTVKKLIIQ